MLKFNDDGNAYKLLLKFLENGNISSVVVLCDTNTKEYCLPVFCNEIKAEINSLNLIEIEFGENNKNILTCQFIWSELLRYGCDRNSLLINLGGGVVTDIGGFTASVYKRGIRFINIPTTLLSMADASLGGKTGIDFKDLKNVIGSFSHPAMTIIDIQYLQTLQDRQLKSGFAEMLKHGLIGSTNHWDKLINYGYNSINYNLIKETIDIKKCIVEKDPYEKGCRKLLNFGHTVGHGIESYALKNDSHPLTHGESIALGMIVESYIAEKLGLLSAANFNTIENGISKFFSNIKLKLISIETIIEFIRNDKKNKCNKLYFVLPLKIGEAKYDILTDIELLSDSLQHYAKLWSQNV